MMTRERLFRAALGLGFIGFLGLWAAGPAGWADEQPPDGDDIKEWSSESEKTKDPVKDILKLMREVEQRLTEWLADAQTRQTQEKIVIDIDGIIDEAESMQQEQQQQQEQSERQQQKEKEQRQRERQQRQQQREQREKSENPDQKNQDPQDRPRDPRERQKTKLEPMPKAQTPKDLADQARERAHKAERWGNYPGTIREDVLDALKRDFPPSRREAIERYYQKLAETEK